MVEADEKTLQVIDAGVVDLAAFDVDMVDEESLLAHEGVEVETKRSHVAGQFPGGFLKGNEHSGFIVLLRSAHEEFGCEESFATTSAAADQGRASLRQTTVGNFVKTTNAGRCFSKKGIRSLDGVCR